MAGITYIEGDATHPIGEGKKIIAHICNDVGGWGAGFVLAISKRWKQPEQKYQLWHKDEFYSWGGIEVPFELGQVQIVMVEPEIYVANMLAQHDISIKDGIAPIRYEALEQCLNQLAHDGQNMEASIHMPRIGCGLAGGKWEQVESIIRKQLVINGNLNVYVYDYNP